MRTRGKAAPKIVALTGLHGSGKTTMARRLGQQGCAVFLHPFTTRAARPGEEAEYEFLRQMDAERARCVWRYTKSGAIYGLREAQLLRLKRGLIGVAPLHLEGIATIAPTAEVIVVALDTLPDLGEQRRRIGDVPGRLQGEEDFAEAQAVLSELPIRVRGDQRKVFSDLEYLCRQLLG